MDKKVTGIVAYITIIGWLVAFVAGDKDNAKFHLNQGLVVGVYGLASMVVGWVLGLIPVVGGILGWILWIVWIVLMVLGILGAAQGSDKELPVIGSIKLLK